VKLTASEYSVALPAWIEDALADVPAAIRDVGERMRVVHMLAERNWREGNGGPFAALVAESATGRIVSVGVNVVLACGVSSAHAEVTALALAQRAAGTSAVTASPTMNWLSTGARACSATGQFSGQAYVGWSSPARAPSSSS
jgi:hypothetical protein